MLLWGALASVQVFFCRSGAARPVPSGKNRDARPTSQGVRPGSTACDSGQAPKRYGFKHLGHRPAAPCAIGAASQLKHRPGNKAYRFRAAGNREIGKSRGRCRDFGDLAPLPPGGTGWGTGGAAASTGGAVTGWTAPTGGVAPTWGVGIGGVAPTTGGAAGSGGGALGEQLLAPVGWPPLRAELLAPVGVRLGEPVIA